MHLVEIGGGGRNTPLNTVIVEDGCVISYYVW